ncbi:MAG TPA: VOC family protein [Sporichthyaceae bacterium]|nr:VOC family protein [Sporichthyaceae bacterium]
MMSSAPGASIPRYSAARWSSARSRPMSRSPTTSSSSTAAEAPPTTSPPSPSRRRATPTGSAASSTSGSRTSTPCTPNLVADIHAVHAEWSALGAQFLTPPKQHQYEIRCYIRDPDGYLIEVGQTTDPQGDWWPADWPPI